ncbi:MAG: STN domain-containing protein, partial [Pseudomonadota bacterium]
MTLSKLAYGSTLIASLALGTLASSQSAAPLAEIDLPAQPLGSAVREFVSQTGVQVSVETALVAGRRSNAVRGASTPREALDQMLAGSGLVVERVATNVFVLRAATPVGPNEDGILELDEIVVSETILGRTPGASGGGAPFDVFEEART